MTTLCDLARKYGTDKCVPHNYTPVYYRLLSERANKVKKVLEVGIGRGAKSLQMWEEFFPNAHIYGVDLDKGSLWNKGRITSFQLNQMNRAEMSQLGLHYGKFDVIIEDGDHKPQAQIAALDVLLPFVTEDGFYFIEDIWAPVADIANRIPPGFAHEVYRSEKPIDLVHHMIMIRSE